MAKPPVWNGEQISVTAKMLTMQLNLNFEDFMDKAFPRQTDKHTIGAFPPKWTAATRNVYFSINCTIYNCT